LVSPVNVISWFVLTARKKFYITDSCTSGESNPAAPFSYEGWDLIVSRVYCTPPELIPSLLLLNCVIGVFQQKEEFFLKELHPNLCTGGASHRLSPCNLPFS
jgi:hypothetical protein